MNKTRADARAELLHLTPRQKQVLDALTDEFDWAGIIARRAGITTTSPGETAARFCIQLVKFGRAEKGGTPMFPKWRRAPLRIDHMPGAEDGSNLKTVTREAHRAMLLFAKEATFAPHPEGNPISSCRAITAEGRRSAEMTVAVPVDDITIGRTYTFEAEHCGETYRWVGAMPEIVGKTAVFRLTGGQLIHTKRGDLDGVA